MPNSNHHYSLHLITALACEAKPLINNYGFKRCIDESAYSIFRNESMTLTVSGVGKLAAAAAVAYTQGRFGDHEKAIWLNIGVAGHRHFNIGDCRIAHKVTDQETKRHWYPSLLYPAPCDTSEIVSVNQPETTYAQNCLYDMEAAGFFASACKFTTLELIHSLKIISDNQTTNATSLNQKVITQLVDNQIGIVDTLISELSKLRQPRANPAQKYIAPFTIHWHFTTHQLKQLSELMSRWEILSLETIPTVENISHLKTSKEVIKWLKHQVSTLPVLYD